MSVFSMIKRGRQAAKEHKAKQVERQKKEKEEAMPYKHVPKHAAIDALASGPATWRESDRPKILEQNRRRSAMTASGVGMGGMGGMMTPVHAGMPRINSALSHVSYPSHYASPVVQMPRSYSYSSIQPGWNNHGGEVVYSHVEPVNGSVKGKEVERVMVDSGIASRSSSKGSIGPPNIDGPPANSDLATSPAGSSGNSTSSQDDLEMKPATLAATSTPSSVSTPATATPTSSRPAGEVDYFHRLHPGHSRRTSDTSTLNQPRGAYVSQRQGGPRVISLPATSAGIPPVPALPNLQFGSPLSQHTASQYPGSTSRATIWNATAPNTAISVPDHASHSTSLAPGTAGPARMPLPEDVAGPIPSGDLEPDQSAGTAITTPTLSHKNRRISKPTRITESDTISSNLPPPVLETQVPEPTRETSVYTTVAPVAALPTEFDESILPAPRDPIPPSARKPAKLTKNAGPKPVKKNRWSLRSGKSTAVAV